MNFWHQSVGKRDDFQRVQRRSGCLLFHLEFATAAFRQTEVNLIRLHLLDQSLTHRQRFLKVFACEAKRAGESRTSLIDRRNLQIGNQPAKIDQRRRPTQGAQMTGCVVKGRESQRGKIGPQLVLLVQSLEVSPRLDHLIGNQLDIRMIDQTRVFLFQADHRSGFGTDDRTSLTSKLGQNAEILSSQSASRFEVTGRNESHSRTDLPWWNMQFPSIVHQDPPQSQPQLGIVTVGEVIDKINHWYGIAERFGRGEPFSRCGFEKGLAGEWGKFSLTGNSNHSFEQPADPTLFQ